MKAYKVECKDGIDEHMYFYIDATDDDIAVKLAQSKCAAANQHLVRVIEIVEYERLVFPYSI